MVRDAELCGVMVKREVVLVSVADVDRVKSVRKRFLLCIFSPHVNMLSGLRNAENLCLWDPES